MEAPITSDEMRSDSPDTNEAFRLLADGTRLEIVQVLGEAHASDDPPPMRFSELRERISADDPGRINYHLNQLATHFVRRTDEGYELREAGKRIVRVLRSGTAIDEPVIDPVEVDVACWFCGGAVELSYEDGWRQLTCTHCSARCVDTFPPAVISKNEVPPSGLLDRTPEEIAEADRIWSAHRRASVMDGVCPECAGTMSITALDICEDHQPNWDDYQFCDHCGSIFWMQVAHGCDVCGFSWKLPTLFYPTRLPEVVAFYHDHGIDLDLAMHEQRKYLLTFEEELLETDPPRIRITIPVEDEELRVTYDERMHVEEVDRTTRSVTT
ncbi:MAG: DUF7351 domain-containing protein [Halobacteriota archaeon]